MRQTRIGKRYATALFDLAQETNTLEKVSADIGLIQTVLKENKDFRNVLKSPIIKPDKKEAIIREIFENKIDPLSIQFLLIITRKKREEYIESIIREFIELYKEYKNIITTYLQTAIKIDSKIKGEVVDLLHGQTGGEIQLIEEVKKELIGGFVLKYKDYQYDASVSKKIADLKKDFNINLYERRI